MSDPDVLTRSWSAWSPSRALRYLRTEDAPSLGSRELLGDVLRGLGRGDDVSILDLGCGNAQFYEYLKSEGVRCAYTGVDVSDPLLDAAHEIHGDDARATFLKADLMTLDGVVGHWDVAVFSHVIEILSGPEDALQAAKRRADVIAIRFFEPPEFETDVVELRQMEVGEGRTVPYLRRKMSRDHYRLILSRIGCRSVDVYQDDSSKDQIHLLRF